MSQLETATSNSRQRRTLTGMVISDKMDKTVVIKVERQIEHPRFRKRIKVSTKLKAHDEENKYKVGDVVKIVQSRPLSKTKSWRVQQLIREAQL